MKIFINSVVILVVLLVLVVIVLILVSRSRNLFSDLGGDKIEVAGDARECERLCWECCRGLPIVGESGDLQINDQCNCLC